MAITVQDIHATADIIVAEGGTPTLAEVRKVLGGGSFTTISDAMKTWKSARQAQVATAPIREAAPTAVGERLSTFGSEIWSIALEMANTRLQSERIALEQARQEMEATQKEAVDLADQLNIEIETAMLKIEQQKSQMDTVIQQNEEALHEIESERAEIATALESEKAARLSAERIAETATAALTEAHHQIDALHVQINELKVENKEIRKEATENYKKSVSLESELSITTERLTIAKNEVAREIERSKLESVKASEQLNEKDELIKVLTKRLEETQVKAAESGQEAKKLEGIVEAMKAQNEILSAYNNSIKNVE